MPPEGELIKKGPGVYRVTGVALTDGSQPLRRTTAGSQVADCITTATAGSQRQRCSAGPGSNKRRQQEREQQEAGGGEQEPYSRGAGSDGFGSGCGWPRLTGHSAPDLHQLPRQFGRPLQPSQNQPRNQLPGDWAIDDMGMPNDEPNW